MEKIVRIDSWQTNHPVLAFLAISFLRFGFRNRAYLQFYKILGTGKGNTFTLNDADPRHWALLTVWDNDSTQLESNILYRTMSKLSSAHRKLLLRPISTRGTWAGVQPFDVSPLEDASSRILVITRARIKVRWWRYFYSQVPPVIVDLKNATGLLERFGIGEAPIGLQGTLSIWSNNDSVKKFAYQTSSHQDVIKKTTTLDWYAEELFARFEILRDEVS